MASTEVRERERIDDDDDSDVDHHKDVLLRAEEVHQMHGHQDEVMWLDTPHVHVIIIHGEAPEVSTSIYMLLKLTRQTPSCWLQHRNYRNL